MCAELMFFPFAEGGGGRLRAGEGTIAVGGETGARPPWGWAVVEGRNHTTSATRRSTLAEPFTGDSVFIVHFPLISGGRRTPDQLPDCSAVARGRGQCRRECCFWCKYPWMRTRSSPLRVSNRARRRPQRRAARGRRTRSRGGRRRGRHRR